MSTVRSAPSRGDEVGDLHALRSLDRAITRDLHVAGPRERQTNIAARDGGDEIRLDAADEGPYLAQQLGGRGDIPRIVPIRIAPQVNHG